MSFEGWYEPGKGTAKNKAQIRISKNFLSISKFCIDNYFKHNKAARIGFDESQNRLIIMPTDETDKLGLKLIGRTDSNFYYLNAKHFISDYKLQPKENIKSAKYECYWDEFKRWIIVENVKSKGSAVNTPHI